MKYVLVASICIVVSAFSVSAASVSDFYTSFYSFGDSLTDDGKVEEGIFPIGGPTELQDPSFEGRFTNGLTWSEYIEDEFADVGKDTENYARGGATANSTNLLTTGPLGTFAQQGAAFEADFTNGALDPGDNPLVSIFLGANDYFHQQSIPFSSGVYNAQNAVDTIVAGIYAISGGATNQFGNPNFKNFLLFDMPLGAVSDLYRNNFASALDLAIEALVLDGFNIIRYDPNQAMEAIAADIENETNLYGIKTLQGSCVDSLEVLDLTPCENPNDFFFLDQVHPTEPVHALIAEQVSDAIIAANTATVVPLPAGGVLLISGLAAIGFLRRRQSAKLKAS